MPSFRDKDKLSNKMMDSFESPFFRLFMLHQNPLTSLNSLHLNCLSYVKPFFSNKWFTMKAFNLMTFDGIENSILISNN